MLRPVAKEVKQQIREENKLINLSIINSLGLKEGDDYDGTKKLKNILPIIPT